MRNRPYYIKCSFGRRYSYIIHRRFRGPHFCGSLMLRIFQLVWNLVGYNGLGLYVGWGRQGRNTKFVGQGQLENVGNERISLRRILEKYVEVDRWMEPAQECVQWGTSALAVLNIWFLLPEVNLLDRQEKYYLRAINPNKSFSFLILLSSFKNLFNSHCMK